MSVLSRVPGLGEATCVQDEPCQCSISVSPLKVGAMRPTAQASVAENALTSLRALEEPDGVATGALIQLEPFQRSAAAAPLASPTASALVAETASTPLSIAQLVGLDSRLGVEMAFQEVPSKRSTIPSPLPPTAHAEVAESASASSRALPLPIAWLGTFVHARRRRGPQRPKAAAAAIAVGRTSAQESHGEVYAP